MAKGSPSAPKRITVCSAMRLHWCFLTNTSSGPLLLVSGLACRRVCNSDRGKAQQVFVNFALRSFLFGTVEDLIKLGQRFGTHYTTVIIRNLQNSIGNYLGPYSIRCFGARTPQAPILNCPHVKNQGEIHILRVTLLIDSFAKSADPFSKAILKI